MWRKRAHLKENMNICKTFDHGLTNFAQSVILSFFLNVKVPMMEENDDTYN